MPWSETDYKSRKYIPELDFMFSAEEQVLAFKKDNVKCYVISAGVLYGIEEQIFREHFETAWLQSPPSLQYVGNGDNSVPTIHVRDLARFVKKVIEVKPETPYVFAVDMAADTKARTIIEGISKGIGSGDVEFNDSVAKTPMFALKKAQYNDTKVEQAGWTTVLQANINVKASSLVARENEEGKEEEVEFEWHCKEGLVTNIKKVAQEYCDVNNLKPIKIYINGPPLAGKSSISKELSKKYNIIHVTYQEVVRLLNSLPDNDWLKEEVDEFLKDNPKSEFPKEILAEGYKRVLRQNACAYRGYVLDGFPRSYSEAKALFYTIPRKPKKKVEEKKENDDTVEQAENPEPQEEEEEQKVKVKFEKDIYPHSFIMLNCEESFVMSRYNKSSQKIPPQELAARLEMYNMLNMVESCSLEENGLTVCNFFQEKKDEVLVTNLRPDTDYSELHEAIRLYVERNGRPFNFLESETRVINAREEEISKREASKKEEERGKAYEEEEQQKQKKREQEEKNRARWNSINEHVQEIKEAQQISTRYNKPQAQTQDIFDGLYSASAEQGIDKCGNYNSG
eukprot:TRINITY_DN185_c0_g1_i1.p1 TRINITY_DN185_c0_g1~~TRINITY_DN185_c0_g1_i1.p1  ORF type:complete len:567 (-),score=101.33 TRINITY_DN185_c0_g1_i1:2567-4267(-)